MRAYLVCALLLLVAADAAKLPPTWKACVLNQPSTDACLAKNIQVAINELATKGAPSLGVYPIDPMRVTKLRLNSGSSGSLALDITFSNLDIYGFRGLRIEQIEADMPGSLKLTKATITSDLVLSGDYQVKGRLLVVPVVSSGRCNMTLGAPVKVVAELALEKYQGADGRTYARVVDFQLGFTPKTLTFQFTDKDLGDSTLGATLNKIANENSREILRDMKPAISEAFGQAYQEIANRILSKVPYADVFPGN